jgi:DNA-binding response OmpR family regulator
MNMDKIILGKKILIVDDEPDVLETLSDLLEKCKIDTASSYEQAKAMFEAEPYDLAILDIMGVDGYGLLEIAKEKKVPAIMLTAHALSKENLLKSAKEGAAYYAPKEELINIKAIVAEVIDAIETNKNTWQKMFDRLAGYYDRQFNGPDWREKEEAFWASKMKRSGL